MKVTCNSCGQDVDVTMYFYSPRIVTQTYRADFSEDYKAIINGKTICPLCGHRIDKIFHSRITSDDILWLATNGEGIKRR